MIKEVSFDDLKDFNLKKNNNPFTKFIAYYDNDILGYIEYNLIYDTIDIVMVYVKEDFRNKGIASNMMKYLIDNYKSLNNITLEVNSLNSIAIKLYESFGFEKVAMRKGYYDGVDGYLMELKL